ncbi:MAG TPA: hypothetical protein VD995_30000 [Azospirillum sp.]|nr:hypothetical protein [Azospirillum sp.]
MKYVLLVAAATMFTAPAFAAPHHNNGNHNGWHKPGNPHNSAPAPLLGAGLPALLLAGGALAWRKRSQKADQ